MTSTPEIKANASTKRRRGGPPQALADSLAELTRGICARQGFAQAEIITRWPEIVGPTLADYVQPDRLTFTKGASGGTLHVLAGGAFALELQHLEQQVLERINGYFGYPAVARLAIKQAPLANRGRQRRRITAPARADREEAERLLPGALSPELRQALASLGAHVIADSRQSPKDRRSFGGKILNLRY